ncbi:MAG: exosome complex exonuclease Rrp41 [Methanomassiliicoccales archaeon]|nr:exosome complex exonuclease Rrp41 [Methanomassiliicoccales archaeon]
MEGKMIDENGLRVDGRKVDELRQIKIEAGVLKRADGSAYVEWGKNKVLAAVYGPRECHPRHLQDPSKALVQCKYNMIAFSVSDRKRPGPDRRSVEISKIISEALEYVVFTEYFPRTSVDVYIEILQANAGTRCAGLTAASVALADAGIPMKDMIPSVAVGKIDGQIVLDLCKEEDNYGQADMPIAIIPRTGEILLMQMDGHMTTDEFNRAMEYGFGACEKIYQLQKDALKRRYAVEDVEGLEEDVPREQQELEG